MGGSPRVSLKFFQRWRCDETASNQLQLGDDLGTSSRHLAGRMRGVTWNISRNTYGFLIGFSEEGGEGRRRVGGVEVSPVSGRQIDWVRAVLGWFLWIIVWNNTPAGCWPWLHFRRWFRFNGFPLFPTPRDRRPTAAFRSHQLHSWVPTTWPSTNPGSSRSPQTSQRLSTSGATTCKTCLNTTKLRQFRLPLARNFRRYRSNTRHNQTNQLNI